MLAVTLDLVSTSAKMLHLNSHYQDMDACVLTNMGLMGLSLKRDFLCFTVFFQGLLHQDLADLSLLFVVRWSSA